MHTHTHTHTRTHTVSCTYVATIMLHVGWRTHAVNCSAQGEFPDTCDRMSRDRRRERCSSDQEEELPGADTGLWSYLKDELTRGYLAKGDDKMYTERQRRMDTFMQTPRQLEKLLIHGSLMCFNAFLFMYTFLPIRIFIGLFQLLFCCRWPLKRPAYVCDIIRAVLLVLGILALQRVDTSIIYHMVRGQSILKLYVIFNMLDIFERLLTSVGRDTLDSLYWLAVDRFCGEPGRRKRKRDAVNLVLHFVISNMYVFLHCIVVLFQAATLNVAINSHNKALLTIMISNQFVELKGSVFKKCAVDNLFQVSCSDMRERFGNVVLIFIVCMRNLAQFNWDLDHLQELLPDVILILGSEVLVDWIKHAFLLKFNNIEPEVYNDYLNVLFTDVASSGRKTNTDLVSGRLGFIPLPFACLVLQTIQQNVKLESIRSWLLLLQIFAILVVVKVVLGLALLRKAHSVTTQTSEKGKGQAHVNLELFSELHRRPICTIPLK